MPYVYVGGSRVSFDPTQAIGKGGEADIYRVGPDKALKVFKQPSHPDYDGQPHEQTAARERLLTHQKKLQEFPKGLPGRVIIPEDLATDQTGQKVLGYKMHLIGGAELLMRYGDRTFRSAGIPSDLVVAIFKDLHQTVAGIHKMGVVLGDFNDLNVLVKGTEAYVIDADSFQFGPYLCKVFTGRFVDPLLCDSKGTNPMLVKPHNAYSDWYAFAVMLFQSLLFVDPYGGVYRPKDPNKRIPHGARPLHRITVFDPEVKYPKPAVPYGVLPDDLLQWFHLIFEKDKREEFPLKALEAMRWTKCSACGTEHARNICPTCMQATPEAVKEVTQIRGQVTATRIFRTRGLVLFATYQDKLRYLYHEDGRFNREDSTTVLSGDIDPQMRFRVKGDTTLIAKNGRIATFAPNQKMDMLATESFGTLPVFDANINSRYWIQGGSIMRDGVLGPEYIGDVLAGQTLFWVGPAFGFGFYRAGDISVSFIFDAARRGINDSLKLPTIRGQLVDSTCVFTSDRCWFFVSTRQGGQTINRCFVIKRDGTLEGEASAQDGDGSWLGTIRGKMAASNFLLAATDEGLVRVEPNAGQIVETRKFPDTEPFVDSGCYIFPGPGGLHIVKQREVWLLKIS